MSPQGYIVAMEEPRSPAAEQYRLLAVRFEARRNQSGLNKLVMTSALPNEGKTYTAVNVAYVLAKDFGRRVLLIDADLKKPSLGRYTGEKRTGLTDMVANRLQPDTVVASLHHESLDLLQAGLTPMNSTRLWKSAAFAEVVAHFTQRYDYLIFDTPPVLAVVDAALIADIADGVAVVVRAGVTPKGAFQKALGLLPKAKVIGTVFNSARVTRSVYYYQIR
jgi:capsular exopolysaccharide synthesis family protein